MSHKITVSILLMSLISGQIFSQPAPYKKTQLPILYSNHKNISNIVTSSGLGYFSDPAENLFDLYHLGITPDSIYGYDSDTQAGTWLNVRYYYSLNDRILKAVNYSDIFYTTSDSLFYDESGRLDSAILESEADQEYDEYAVKHVYTYESELMTSELVSIDNSDDSIHNNWNISRSITYKYDSYNRLIGKLTQRPNGDLMVDFYKSIYMYSMNTGGEIDRYDSNFITFPGLVWYPTDISHRYFDADTNCFNIQILQFAPYYNLKPDSFGEPSLVNVIDMEYDSIGNLTNELTTQYSWGQSTAMKNIYEYNYNGTRKSKTTYEPINSSWFLTYQYLYYYSPGITAATYIENQKFKIFPNPVNDVLYIEGLSSDKEIEILTCDGKVLSSMLYNNAVHVNYLPAGLYIIKIKENDKPPCSRIFIKN
jgi:hypothetical protein